MSINVMFIRNQLPLQCCDRWLGYRKSTWPKETCATNHPVRSLPDEAEAKKIRGNRLGLSKLPKHVKPFKRAADNFVCFTEAVASSHFTVLICGWPSWPCVKFNEDI